MRFRLRVVFAWYDLWIGFYLDRKGRALYFFPVPMIGFEIRDSKRTITMSMYGVECSVCGAESGHREGCSKDEQDRAELQKRVAAQVDNLKPREIAELLPCPFCGSDKTRSCANDGRCWRECISCGATGPLVAARDDDDDPDWNRRAPVAATTLPPKVDHSDDWGLGIDLRCNPVGDYEFKNPTVKDSLTVLPPPNEKRCTICKDPAMYHEDEGVWRHKHSGFEGGQFLCDKYGYPIKVEDIDPTDKESLTVPLPPEMEERIPHAADCGANICADCIECAYGDAGCELGHSECARYKVAGSLPCNCFRTEVISTIRTLQAQLTGKGDEC